MTPLYLTSIELAEFRSFAHLEIKLAPEPGVLIVHGSNGLGKSSLFDALEWTLTGGIDHFRGADGYKKFGNYLCRWGENIDPTSAALLFSDGKRIERQLASAKAPAATLKGDVADITEYLRVPGWTQSITDLNRYLLLTHFLGQSTLSRLTHREPSERFEILKEAAQSADLEKFGLALHGPGTTLPAKAFAKRIAELERDTADLRALLELEAETWSGAQASGALDDGEASAMSGEIIAAVDKAWLLLDSQTSVWGDPLEAATLQTAIGQVEELARKREFAITEARRLFALRQRHEAALTQATASTEETKREFAAVTTTAEEARQETSRRRAALNSALGPLTVARDAYGKVVELSQAAVTLQSTRAERQKGVAELTATRAALARAEQTVRRNERRRQIEARLSSEKDAFDKVLASTRVTIEEGQQWLNRRSAIETTTVDLKLLEEANPDIEAIVASASLQVESARAVVVAQTVAMQLVQRSVDELSAAVSSIAINLPESAQECPVCATDFASSAELHARVNDAAERLAPLVLVQQNAVRAADTLLTSVESNLARHQEALDRIHSLKDQVNIDSDLNGQVLVRLGWDAGFNRENVEQRLAALEENVRQLEMRRKIRVRWIGRLISGNVASAVGSDAIRHRDDARRAEDAAVRSIDDLAAAERIASETFATRAMRLFPGDTLPTREQIDAATKNAATILAERQQDYNAASEVLTEQELQLASLQAAEAGLKARLEQSTTKQSGTQKALTDMSTQWRAAGWTDEGMTESKIEVAATDLNRARQFLSEAEAMLKRLREGREAWSRQQSHHSAFERLILQVDLAPNSTRDQVRASAVRKLEDSEAGARATVESKEIASNASAAIANAVSEFNAEYIEPLDQLTKRINQAILCDPRIGIDLHVNKKTIKQSASRAGELPPERKIDPILVHSEGQMAALAVSMLCAASLTYPWSRWRALVFDDPLQHNDAIHAAAFADLVGNLIQAKGYQILLSTHDLGQSDFLRRKFEARKIPCAVLNLLGRGKAGVEWDFRPSGNAEDARAVSA